MLQSRQSPESLQYIDAKFALERGIGVKFCISLFTEFSLYYLKGMKIPFFRGSGQHHFERTEGTLQPDSQQFSVSLMETVSDSGVPLKPLSQMVLSKSDSSLWIFEHLIWKVVTLQPFPWGALIPMPLLCLASYGQAVEHQLILVLSPVSATVMLYV